MRTYYAGAGSRPLTLEDVDLLIAGQAVMVTPFGDHLPHKLNAAGLAEYAEAQRRGWIYARTTALKNAWFAWCKANRHPYVWVEQVGSGRLARVEMDLIGYPKPDRPAMDRVRAEVDALCREHAQQRRYYAGAFTRVAVLAEAGPEVATRLVELVRAASARPGWRWPNSWRR